MENSTVKRFLAILACLWGSVAYADQNSIVIPETGPAWDLAHPANPPLPHTFENTTKFFINPILKSITSNFSGNGCGNITSPVPWQWCVDSTARTVNMWSQPAAGGSFAWQSVLPLNSNGSFPAARRPVNPKDYGALCDGATDDHAALQAALDAAIAQGRPLYIPGRYCANSSSLTLSATVDIFGDGAQNSIILMTADVPAFVWTISSTIERFNWQNFSIQGPASSTGAAILTQGGSSSNFWQRGQLRNIQFIGFLYGIEINNTAGGHWTLYDAVKCTDGATQFQYCIYGPQGSGTGNVFTNFIPQMNRSGNAVIRFEGTGKNVGDIVISNGHFGNSGSVLSVGPGTTYRSRISLMASQYDAGSVKAFDFDATGVEYTDIRSIGNNVGGATVTGIPVNTNRSQIDDQDIGLRKAGNVKNIGGSGTISTPLFSLVFPSGLGVVSAGPSDPQPLAGWNGASCSVVVDGLIGGTGAGVSRSDFLVSYGNTGSPTFTAGPTSATAGAWTVAHAETTNTITISASVAQTSSSIFEANISCTGGMFALNRL